jgi:predicted solute-binding protein
MLLLLLLGVLALVSLVGPWWSQGKEMPLPLGCVRQRQPILMQQADAMGVATIDGVAVDKAADVEDSGGVVPKTEENTC